MKIFKSILACVVGVLVGAVLSTATDSILQHAGILPKDSLWVASSIVVLVIFYRTVYNVVGSYIVARLAPHHPMRHAMIVGIIGTLGIIISTIATWNMNLGPHWYCFALIILGLPSAWLGGKLFTRRT